MNELGTSAYRLLGDRLFQACLGVYGVALVVLAGAALSPRGRAGDLHPYVALALWALTVFALLWGRARVPGHQRRFWDLLGAAAACWLLVELFSLSEIGLPLLTATFLADLLYIFFYLLFALALDQRPHTSGQQSRTAFRRRLEAGAGLAAIFGLLTYFGLVVFPEPLGLSVTFATRDRGLTALLLVHISLDAFLFLRAVYAALTTRGEWVRVYTLLAVGLVCLGARDTFALLQYRGLLSLGGLGFAYESFLLLPSFLLLVAGRYGRLLPVDTVEAETGNGDLEARDEVLRASPLSLYALLVPGVHFLLYPLGLLDQAVRPSREVFALVYLAALGLLAWVHQRVMEREARRAREALHEAEKRLFRSQRLESVGRLAGGIAHDFNNYLTVIQGYGELLRERLQDPEAQEDVEYIEDAANKATHLTRQLLAFGRRQVLRPEPLELNTVVLDTSKLLDSLLGEDVKLEVELGSGVGLAHADLGQTEQVLVNLALNGRDAMPGGGSLTVRTERVELSERQAKLLEVEPGSYACLLVTDTGCGMTEELRSQVFEPFFTTKEPGRGTGLGLSTVYGIVTQSGGAIQLESAPGEGTTVRVLLPSAEEPRPAESARAPKPVALERTVNLLLVEDQEQVRSLAASVLTRGGFRVFEASGGHEALDRFPMEAQPLDLLVTDVMMPDMDGVELANTLSSRCPELRVLFVSGYPTETLRERQAALPKTLPLLEKPFTPAALLEAVHRVLEERPPSR